MTKGFIIKGSAVRGTKKLIFKTRAEAQRFTRKVGGRAVPIVRQTSTRKLKKRLSIF